MIIFIAFGVIIAVVFIQRFIYVRFAFTNLKCNYYFSEAEVNEGDVFYINEEIENKKYLPLPAVSTVLAAGAGVAFANAEGKIIDAKSVFIFSTVGIYKKITRTWRVKAIKRGRYNIDSITVNVKDIFGLVSVAKDFSCDSGILILPSAYNRNDEIELPNFTGGAMPVLAGYFSDPFNIMKISPYTYAEPFNKINWKASAKTRTLMVNYEQPAVSDRVLVVLEASEASFLLEKNIKLCATLSRLIPDGSEITFLSNAIFPDDYINPLINYINAEDGILKSREFTLSSHDRNFRRILAEILQGSKHSAEKMIEWQTNCEFYGTVLLVKGGKINNYDEFD